jgi:hypothetical protein
MRLVTIFPGAMTRFADNPFVRGAPGVRFYCGAPLVSASGHVIGTLCFADNKPRADFDVSKCYLINNMAEIMVRQLERYTAHAGPAGTVGESRLGHRRVRYPSPRVASERIILDRVKKSGVWRRLLKVPAWQACRSCRPLNGNLGRRCRYASSGSGDLINEGQVIGGRFGLEG